MEANRSERGQTLVLIILAIVGLLGFAALSVDIGRVFAERRRAQSAADAAAYAAAIAQEHDQDWAVAGINQAFLNDYGDNDPNENLDARMDVQVYHPPISGPYSDPNRPDYMDYYQVFIRQQVDPVFAHFVFDGLLEFTVESVARSREVKGMYPGDALVAMNPSDCKALWFQGNHTTWIKGGNVFSNSNRTGQPASCDAGVSNGDGTIEVVDGSINTVGTFAYDPSKVSAGDGINTGVYSQDMPSIPLPDCSHLPFRIYEPLPNSTPGPNKIYPGRYRSGIRINAGENVDMVSGMYCIEGGFTMLGGSIRDVRNPETGTSGVFIVMLTGDLDFSGNTVVHLNHMSDLKGAIGDPDYQWGGMLIYMPYLSPYLNTGQIHIGGGGNSTYTGTVYAPGPRPNGYKCVIEGTGDSVALASNIICNTIYITGDATVKITYKQEGNFQMPPVIELSQ